MVDYIDGGGLRTKLLLPFAVPAEDRMKAFTKDMEMAAVLYLAESNREKGEGYILKKPDEKMVFLAEVCYPLWLIPWSGGTLLFDGLGNAAYTLSHEVMPDIRVFNKDIQRSAKTCKAYSSSLSRNANYFKNFVSKEKKTIEGLIASPDFIKDFMVYLSEVEEAEKPLSRKAVLSRMINKPEIAASVAELAELRTKIDEDVKNLETSMKLLRVTTRERVKAVRKEIRKVRKNFDKQIEKANVEVKRRIRRIRERHDEKIIRISRQFKRQLGHIHKDRIEFEKTLRRLRAEIKRCQAKIKSCRRRKNKRIEIQWTKRLKRIKKKLPTFEKRISDTDRKMGRLEDAEKLEISHQRTERDKCIDRAIKVLSELEASREASIRIKRQEITSLKNSTSLIMNQMSAMAKSKKAALGEFGRICLPRSKRVCALVYLPFYLARYRMEAKNRYVVYPPSIVSSMGIMTKMKGVLGAAKMKAFLHPRSKAITLFLNQVATLIQRNPVFEKEITDAGIEDSVLRRKELRLGVKRGLKELKDEEWISKNEFQTLSKLLYIYT